MNTIQELSPQEVEEKLENDKNIEVIDVREDEEVAQGKIEQAKHIPLQEIPEAVNKLDKSKDYVMVCRSGRRSMKAASFLQDNGYRVYNMAGGMLEWKGDVSS
ncbi:MULTISPECIES: rhodanese-like domain-containing protein [Virgibacillus]|uniref:Molybdopterin biosynthesis protein MoeB n=2 Tax=Virgibacillus TaxID=84406 RepID=A0A024Q9P4_9BACI|nr:MULTISPECIES: rhodanese-like domain-containing protein [Virgibacillus]EQB37238.1 hypothetical protein M948_01515 [Virgibacillus sp. CM-4]MYL39995.1 rhodanese-like domain-containing protein [Virgibacillus massiliensis]GGJ62988.1 hypothetical protein GCM10007111_26390 [Virgibacillus kapii]CDQ39263.1 molybdopterin biosynthesis protein MoeB [Virgibacillus massiliensis]